MDLDEFTSFLQNKGFIWGPEPELYGGMAGFYTYAPLGKLLKNNVERVIRDTFIKYGFWEVECPVVMPEEVWVASGHVGGFTDPLIKDEQGGVHRVDKLIQEWCDKEGKELKVNLGSASKDDLLKLLLDNNITAPNGAKLILEIKDHDLMMKTTVGVDKVAYNRPETATTTYLPFARYHRLFREKLPFGVFQIGKAFRNEISPRNSVLRGREFTQAEGQLFLFEDQKNEYEPYSLVENNEIPLWSEKQQQKGAGIQMLTLKDALKKGVIKSQSYIWALHLTYELFRNMGVPQERIRLRQHHKDEMAFYANDAWDVEINLNTFGWEEVCGVHDRSDYDLKQHAKHSKTSLEVSNNGKKETPHIIEIAFGTDRPTFALLDIYYDKKDKEDGKSILHLPAHMAPVQVAVFPLLKKENLIEKAQEIFTLLQKQVVARFDQAGSIGRRYLREDESGTPYCITVDFDGLEDDTVTVRDRDSEKQKRVKISEIKTLICELVNGETDFAKI